MTENSCEKMNVKEVVSALTLDEKCALLSGIDFWHTTPIAKHGIKSARMSDGPHGLRREVVQTDVGNTMPESAPATCFPPAVTLASTWNRKAVAMVGKTIATEAVDQGIDTVLGPGVNIKRNPLCGRNFEYFSEDPFLAGELSASYINGLQSGNVGTSLKHFAVNSQEFKRLSISSELDERTLREIYLSAFERAVKKAQPQTIMCSYNRINGEYSSDNKKLLTDILRNEWGFKGIVVSDWGAVNDRVKGVLAGMDLEMPTSDGLNDKLVADAVRNGTLKEEDLDVVVERVLSYVKECYENRAKNAGKNCDYDADYEVARRVAAEGAVLLKNDGMLPLSEDDDYAVIGNLASKMRYQGGGSSNINPYKLCSFVDCLTKKGKKIEFAKGYAPLGDGCDDALLAEAVELAKRKKNILLFIGLTDEYESEGYDRTHLNLPEGHNRLVEAVAAVNENVTVVLSCGSPVILPWLDKVKSVLNVYLSGEAGGESTYDLLFGKINPSGKLAETFPLTLADNPAYGEKYFQAGPLTVEYRESIYVGYRYFDSAKKNVLFPFGYGLSYTKFDYSNLAVKQNGTDTVVTFDVTNVGDCAGAEVVQLYVKDVESTIYREEKSLKGFDKVFLEKGEKKTVTISLDKRAFSFYNVKVNDWTIEKGDYEIMVGASSRDIRLSTVIFVDGEEFGIPNYIDTAPIYYNIEIAKDFPDADFHAIYGGEPTKNEKFVKETLTLNATIDDCRELTRFGAFMYKMVYKFSVKLVAPNTPDTTKEMVQKSSVVMPIRTLYTMSNGLVPKKAALGLLQMMKGHFFTGLGKVICGFIGNVGHKKKGKFFPPEK